MLVEQAIVPGSTRQLQIDECRPQLQELYALWQELRAGRPMPARRDFDPLQVPKLLPDIFLVDVMARQPVERRYRVRLQGTTLAERYGADWTGAYLHEMIDRDSADRFCAVGDVIVRSRAPWISTGDLYWLPEKPFYRFETIMLPLSDDGAQVNMILGLTRLF